MLRLTGSRSVSCVVNDAATQAAVKATHTAFNFAHQFVPVVLLSPTPGTAWGTVAEGLVDYLMTHYVIT